MASRILVLHGPNLALAAADLTPQVIDARLLARATALGVEVRCVQSNHEGVLLDTLAEQRGWAEAVIVNPTTLAPVAFPLSEALTLLGLPAIEVQLGNPGKGKSALKKAVESQIHGKGVDGYLEALNQLAPRSSVKAAAARETSRALTTPGSVAAVKRLTTEPAVPALPPKTLGRSERETPMATRAVEKRVEKTIGEKPPAAPAVVAVGKTLGRKPAAPARGPREQQEAHGILTRARVREQIAERLAGSMTPAALATWARARWADLQAGSPAESGQRERLEDVLQTLIVAAAQKASDQALIELMVQLER